MNEITYTMVGDYNLPDLILPEQPEPVVGKWSQMRRTFLKEQHRVQYYNLLTERNLDKAFVGSTAEGEQNWRKHWCGRWQPGRD